MCALAQIQPSIAAALIKKPTWFTVAALCNSGHPANMSRQLTNAEMAQLATSPAAFINQLCE